MTSSNNRAEAIQSNEELVAESGLTNTESAVITITNHQKSNPNSVVQVPQVQEPEESKVALVTADIEDEPSKPISPASPAESAREKFEKKASEHLSL